MLRDIRRLWKISAASGMCGQVFLHHCDRVNARSGDLAIAIADHAQILAIAVKQAQERFA
jgi:hypothetical protein